MGKDSEIAEGHLFRTLGRKPGCGRIKECYRSETVFAGTHHRFQEGTVIQYTLVTGQKYYTVP